MIFKHIPPPESLLNIIRFYWVIEDSDTEIVRQKIVPDGFPEIIFHYGDPYRINITDTWERQENFLFAGQITRHFALENTGRSGMIGIKLQPSAPTRLFDINMSSITNRVINGHSCFSEEITEILLKNMHSDLSYAEKVSLLNSILPDLLSEASEEDQLVKKAVDIILNSNGTTSVQELCEKLSLNERKLERLFEKKVGLSPKFFSRVIRFSHIFKLVEQKPIAWSELAYLSGFYDQSHFIKNFQEFTGEDPTAYYFEEKNMANFFMRSKQKS